ncbi:MAG: molybdenum cofactor guanylyltransferase [Acidobacteriia bacterium]|nr:molybdenum cofactor guanylyltransferase [Terriglobia bacterium]
MTVPLQPVLGDRREAVYYPPMSDSPPDVAAFVLAGGKSTRMGTDKAFVAFDGRSLLARALDLARSVTPDVYIVGDSAKFSAFAPVVEDLYRDCGPLAGIHAALRTSTKELNLILAVDVPFVSLALLHYLIRRAQDSSAAVTVPRAGGGWQPLCAVYRREFADAAQSALQRGDYKIDALFDTVKVQVIEEEELTGAGFSPRIFRNLNTKEELEAAKS